MTCKHLEEANLNGKPRHTRSATGKYSTCAECAKTGDWFLHLRLCKTCGEVLCCESSPNQHAKKHSHATGHPVAQSIEPGEDWLWCYVDQREGESAPKKKSATTNAGKEENKGGKK